MKNLFSFLLVLTPIAFGQVPLTTAQIAKRVSPSVVVIQGITDSGDVLGSGFIISKDGKIVTNFHVIRDMKTASVQLATGDVFDSLSVLAIDERRDLAIVQIPTSNLPVLELGNSDVLTVGEPLVIVGSPRGLEGTVTAGILSSIRDLGDGFKVLQTDAAVNPGNSGGPLLNNRGQTVGVVSFQLRSTQGLNFAIPINYVLGLLDSLHEPISLPQMRAKLTPKTATGAKGDDSETVSIGGVGLRLGMNKDTVLASFVGASDVKVSTVDPAGTEANQFAVFVKRLDGWDYDGSLIFHSGKLTHIGVTHCSSNEKAARTVAKAFYTAMASADLGL